METAAILKAYRDLKPLQETGGARGIRTPDLRNAIAALSQLSYDPGPRDAAETGR